MVQLQRQMRAIKASSLDSSAIRLNRPSWALQVPAEEDLTVVLTLALQNLDIAAE